SGARRGGHLFVTQLLDVLEEKRFTLDGIELGDRAFDRVAQLGVALARVDLGVLDGGFIEHHASRTALAVEQQRTAAIDENTHDPRPKAQSVVEPRERSMRAQK